MRKIVSISLLCLTFLLSTTIVAAADGNKLPKKKQTTLGLYLSAKEAHDVLQKDGKNVLFVDVRSRAEVAFLGMPSMADANIPYMKLSEWYAWDNKKNNFKMELNDEFLTQIEDRLALKELNKDSKIVFICRSGSRSASAANLLAKAGYKNVYSVIEGYEGDKAKSGPEKGQRVVNGWKNEGLPWSYKLLASKMYVSDE